MPEKKYTQKEVLELLKKQRKSDADCLKSEPSISGYTAMRKVEKNGLVLKVKQDAIQE